MKRLSSKQLGWLFALLSSLFFLLYIQPFISFSNAEHSAVFRFRDGHPETIALSQPDIAINYAFIYNQLIFRKVLFVEPISDFAIDQLHPRSTTVIHNQITPIGFPGVIAFLSLMLLPWTIAFGTMSANFFLVSITAIAAATTPIFFFYVVAPFFKKRVALIAATLLYVMPLWWYYGSWLVNQSIWLLFFIVQALFWGTLASKWRHGEWRYIYAALSGLTFGLAIFIRPVSMLWLGPVLICIGWLRRKRLRLRYHYLPFFTAASIIAIYFAYTQIVFYGSFLGSGYVPPALDGSAGTLVSQQSWWKSLSTILLPYGLHPIQIAKNSWQYLLRLVFPWTVLAGIGVALVIRNRQHRSWYRTTYYTYLYLGVSIFLVLYYGSSKFFDSPIGNVPTIGTSYTRYFLPIYVFGLPLVARGLMSISNVVRRQHRGWAIILVMIMLTGHGYYIAHKRTDGLDMLSRNMQQFYVERDEVLQRTAPHGVIVTNSADKYLFPYRRTLVSFSDAPSIALDATRRLVQEGVPVYWYYHVPHNEFVDSWKKELESANLHLSEPIYDGYNMELRKIEILDEIQ